MINCNKSINFNKLFNRTPLQLNLPTKKSLKSKQALKIKLMKFIAMISTNNKLPYYNKKFKAMKTNITVK